MDKKEFIKRLKDDENNYSIKEMVIFLLREYILQDYKIDDFEDDLIFKYNFTGTQARKVMSNCRRAIKDFVNDYNENEKLKWWKEALNMFSPDEIKEMFETIQGALEKAKTKPDLKEETNLALIQLDQLKDHIEELEENQ